MEVTEKATKSANDYRAYVGPMDTYDLVAATQFNLLTSLGLREHHYLLDIGCGSLRAGRLFIPYLQPEHYCGIEPNSWLIKEGIQNECGYDLIALKKPSFDSNYEFQSTMFRRKFDFVLIHSIFTHATQKQITNCLSETVRVIKPNTVFAVTFIEGSEDYEGDEWVYPNVVAYKMSTMQALMERFDLCFQPFDWPHPNKHTWLLMSPTKESIPTCPDTASSARMISELEYYKRRVEKLESSLYVKIGIKAKKLIRKLKS
jgi:SAM-dependent methyltransferase